MKITNGFETGDKESARKQVAQTRRSKHRQMLVVSQQDFVVVIKENSANK